MRWKKGRRSRNIEDLRGSGGRPRVGRGIKLGGGATILALLAALLLGQDPGVILNMLGGGGNTPLKEIQAPEDEGADFISVVLADTEDTWGAIFSAAGGSYTPPKMVLYSDMVESACGMASSASGPFYCPRDQKVYLDLSFFRELRRMGAPGDFAQAYVVSHEIGHHIQKLVGTIGQVGRLQARASKTEKNALSVRMELQADCYAGVWAHHAHKARDILERGDVEEGLAAAASVGDDRIQRMAGRHIQPESFTHGSSKQRIHWFRTGLKTGSTQECNTFSQSSY